MDKSPWTSYSTVTSNGFAAIPLSTAPNATDYTTDGLLAVDQPRYSVVALDVSGAAVNLTNFVEQVSQERLNPKSQAALPALRSGGLSLTVSGRATDMAAGFQSASQNNTAIEAEGDGGQVVLGAAELSRGVRADVWDSVSQTWSSLCERTYQINGVPAGPVSDEGTLTASATTHPALSSTESDLQGDLHMVETLLRWTGSGLSVPPPGAPSPEKQSSVHVMISPASNPSPQLLFGRGYRFRLRRVDLAGNSVAATDGSIAKTPHITPETSYWTSTADNALQLSWSQVPRPTRYLRFEPVVPPVVRPVVAAIALHGESTGVLVVRTGASPLVLRIPNTRRIDPPAIAPALALQHGLTPAQIKSPQLPDSPTLLNPKNLPAAVAPQDKLTTYNQALSGTAVLPYTPDPLAAGTAFQVSSAGTFANLLSLNIPSVEANGSPFLLSLAAISAGTAPAAVLSAPSAANGNLPTLSISLPPASVLKLRVSSTLNHDGLEMLALWDLTKQAIAQSNPGGGGALNQAMTAGVLQAIQGLMPMLTPYREITLVHALEKPVAPVLVDSFGCQTRAPSQTSAYLSGGLQSDRNSTTKVDVSASWMEWVDVAPAAPTQVQYTAHVLSATIAMSGPAFDSLGDGAGALPAHQEFHDTRYRQVSYTPLASTRFAEYFAPSATPQVPDPHQQQSGAAVSLAIPSTARPPAPTIRYIMPTFRWMRTEGLDGSVTSTRLGGGFRVFVERPWYCSGDGELLAVVLAAQNSEFVATPVLPVGAGSGAAPPQTTAAPDAALLGFATRAGANPLFAGVGPSADIAVGNFQDATASVPAGLVLPEAASANVGVAGYMVRWNDAHQAWCSDIHVDPYQNAANGQHYFGYMPFIRFALARYQPNALPGYELSTVVRMDSVQSVPDRTASIASISTSTTPGSLKLNVSYLLQVTGETAQGSAATISWAVELEETISGAPAPQTEVDWQVVPGGAELEFRTINVLCAATISLPTLRGTRGYRVVVTETETYPSDNRHIDRIVYADVILL